MIFNLEKWTGKKLDINPDQIVARSIHPRIKELSKKDMKPILRDCREGETPNLWAADIFMSNPNILVSKDFDSEDKAIEFLESFKEGL
jgi:hypothetical protein